MTKLFLILFLSLASFAYAGVLKGTGKHFTAIGTAGQFSWAPERYQSQFKYDVLYFIPESLRNTENVKTLIFMHGGGASTQTREGSLSVTNSYFRSTMISIANDLQTVVVVPSASGLNWGGHTVGMIRDLNNLLRKELNVDHNNMGLSGHSMGGMGIGRSFYWLADEFAYFLPMAAGIDEKQQSEYNLNKAFNVPYVHLQGLKDHFQIFVERCREQTKRTSELETKYGEKSQLEVIYYNGSHNHDYKLMKDTLARLQRNPRNVYQNILYGSLYYNNNFYTENNINFQRGSTTRYFWVEMLEASGTEPERLDFRAQIKNNIIMIDLQQMTKSIKKLRIHLSKKMLRSDKQIEIILNGVPAGKTMLQDYPYVDRIDPEFAFDDYIDIEI